MLQHLDTETLKALDAVGCLVMYVGTGLTVLSKTIHETRKPTMKLF